MNCVRGGEHRGLTILEISSFIAAPLGGLTPAQLGADINLADLVARSGPGTPSTPAGLRFTGAGQSGSGSQCLSATGRDADI